MLQQLRTSRYDLYGLGSGAWSSACVLYRDLERQLITLQLELAGGQLELAI